MENTFMSSRTGRYTAFTLVELLVVVGIIALLLAILLPSMGRAKEQTRITMCQTNLHNYGMAGSLYSDDNRQTFPYSFSWLFKNGRYHRCCWHLEQYNLNEHPEEAGVLWPYLKNIKVHVCPSFKRAVQKMGDYSCNTPKNQLVPQFTYSMNSYLNGDALTYSHGIMQTRQVYQVARPAQVFYFSEENSWVIPGLNRAGINDNNLRALPDGRADSFATFHRAPKGDLNKGNCNAVFVDGHVDEVSPYPYGNTFRLSWPGATLPNW